MTELVLRNARLVRLDDVPGADDGPELVDVAVEGGRVTAVGPRLDARGEEEIDLEGRWLMPGLWDNHAHMTQWALDRKRVDVSGARSAAEAAAVLAERARLDPPPPGVALVGRGLRDALFPDLPVASLLDEALAREGVRPDVTVVVSGDLHSAWFNTRALEAIGVAGHPTGLLKETEWMGRMGALDQVPAGVLDRWVDEAAREAASRGVVGIVDFEIAENLGVWRRRVEAGSRWLRVDAGVWPQFLDHAEGLATGDVVPGTHGLVRLGPLKVISDGSLNSRTAYCTDPYPGTGGHGVLNVPTEELTELLRHAHAHGIRAAVHAIGDRANTLALDAFEASGARGTVEHAQLLHEADVERMARLGIVASVQPAHLLDDRDVADHHWAGRTDRAFAYGSLARAGVRMAFGSDAPVAPLDPWAAPAVRRASSQEAPTARRARSMTASVPPDCARITPMKATRIHGHRDIRLDELPDPRIVEPTDAVVRVVASCICGSDLWQYRKEGPVTPWQIGHEFVGVVEQVGSAVRTVKEGDFVIAPFVWSDNTCEVCQEGLQTSCLHGGGWGSDGVDGGQGEKVRVPLADGTLVPAPVGEDSPLVPALLTLSDVMGTGHHAARAAGVGPGSHVAVVGDGAVGLCAVLAAKRLGAERVTIFSRHADRTAVARRFGATDVVAERGKDGVAHAKELTGGLGFRHVVEAVGSNESWAMSLGMARPGGTVGFVGVPIGATEGISPWPLFDKNVTIRGGVAPTRSYIPEFLPEVLDGTLDPSPVFDLELPLSQVAEGYRAMDERRAIKVLLRPGA